MGVVGRRRHGSAVRRMVRMGMRRRRMMMNWMMVMVRGDGSGSSCRSRRHHRLRFENGRRLRSGRLPNHRNVPEKVLTIVIAVVVDAVEAIADWARTAAIDVQVKRDCRVGGRRRGNRRTGGRR